MFWYFVFNLSLCGSAWASTFILPESRVTIRKAKQEATRLAASSKPIRLGNGIGRGLLYELAGLFLAEQNAGAIYASVICLNTKRVKVNLASMLKGLLDFTMPHRLTVRVKQNLRRCN